MNHTIDGGGSSVGIDPDALDTLITDAGNAAENIEGFASTYRGRFSSNDVTTSNIGQLEGVAEWIRDQLPMLRRRRDMAQIAADQSGTSFVTAGAGELPWDTAEEAAQAGQEDAARLLEDADPGEIPDEVYELLQEHSNDPDYLEAFFNEAGPEVLQTIQYDAAISAEGDETLDPGKMVPMSYALATASHRIDFHSDEWVNNTGNGWNAIVPYMEYGVWSENFLHAAGDELIHLGHESAQATVLNALARNPVAAANWYQDSPPEGRYGWETNAEWVGQVMSGNYHGLANTEELDAAMTNMLDAATNDVSRYDQELANESVRTLLENVNGWPDDWAAGKPYQQFFGELAERHVDDMYDSVTSPLPSYFDQSHSDRDGVEAPAAWWASLTEQAMRDEQTAANLSIVFEQKYDEVNDRWEGTAPDETEYANNLPLAQAHQWSGWFVERVDNTREDLELSVEEWNQRMETGVGLLFDVATDPQGTVKGLAIDGAKNLVTSIFEKDTPDYNVDTEWATSLEQNLHGTAANSYDKKRNEDGTLPEVTLNYGDYEVTYDGNPADYEDQYGGRFTDDDGNILPIEDIEEQGGMQAYLEWVQDPAVQQAYWDDFRADMPAGLE